LNGEVVHEMGVKLCSE